MLPAEPYKYWAFISYSHQDRDWARWLHKTLEAYRVPSRLVGRESRLGKIPRRLFPIFRDRDELPSSANLGEVINQALRQSRYQIVICSPRSASSQWVNEEVQYFKSLGREDRVLCLIIDGTPGATDQAGHEAEECFAPALRFVVNAQGTISTKRAHPVAADARRQGDGRDSALLKLLAGLLGVGFDELRQRERQRRLLRLIGNITVAAAVIAGFAGLWHLRGQQLETRERRAQIERLFALGKAELSSGHSGRASAALARAYQLGGQSPALRLALGQAMLMPDALQQRLQTDAAPVTRVALSPDGRRLAAVSDSRLLSLWDTRSGKRLANIPLSVKAHFRVERPIFSDDGRYLQMVAFVYEDAPTQRLLIVDVEAGRLIIDRDAAASMERQVFRPFDSKATLLINVTPERRLQILSLPGGEVVREWNPPGRLRTASFTPDDEQIITGAANGDVVLWNWRSAQVVRRYAGARDQIVSIATSEDGQRLIAGVAYGPIKVWDLASGALQLAGGQRFTVNYVRFSQDGQRYLSIADDGLRVWDATVGAVIYSSPQVLSQAKWASIAADGRLLASANEGPATLWNLSSGRRIAELDAHRGGAYDIVLSDDGNQAAVAGSDGFVSLWNARIRPRWSQPLGPPADPVQGQGAMDIGFDPTGRRYASVGSDAVVDIRDGVTHRLLHQLQAGGVELDALQWSHDGQQLLSIDHRGRCYRHDANSGALLGTLETGKLVIDHKQVHVSRDLDWVSVISAEKPDQIQLASFSGRSRQLHANSVAGSLAFDPARSWLAISNGSELIVEEVASGRIVWRAQTSAPTDLGEAVSYSAAGEVVAVIHHSGALSLYDAQNGTPLARTKIPESGPFDLLALSADGRRAAVSSTSGHLWLWTRGAQPLSPLSAHLGGITALEFSPDGAQVLSGSNDNTARLWTADDGIEIGIVAEHGGAIDAVHYSPLGNEIATASSDNSVALWPVEQEARSTEQIADIVRCSVAWSVQGDQLIAADVAACRPSVSGALNSRPVTP